MTVPIPPTSPTIFGYPADDITAIFTLVLAIGTILLAGATAGLVYAAFMQLPLLTTQIRLAREADENQYLRQIETNTITACGKYDTDPVLYEIHSRIWKRSDGGKNYSRENIDEHDAIMMLNYLDGIAIGVKQGVLSGAITKDHLGAVYEKAVDVMIPALFGNFDGYEAIAELRNSWKTPTPPAYKARP